jgi:hypothetical protein
LHGVAVREAPVVIRLRKGDDSGWLDLRRVDGRLFRPVLAPGSWREVGAGEFVEALWHGVPWADNPAQAKTPQYVRTSMRLIKTVPLAMDDYAIAPTERSRRDCLSEKAAADAVSARCAGLAVIDGIVHRPTEEPVVLLTDASESMVFWRVDDLVQCDIQQTLFQLAEIPWLQMGGWVFRGAMSFPLGDEPLVWEVLSRWKGTSRRRPVVAAGCEALPAADPDAMIGFLREAVSTGPLHPASKVLDEVPKSAWDWRSPDEVDPAVVAVVRVAAMASAAAERMDEDAGRGLRLVAAVAATLARRLPNIRLRTE